jgi:hypothetical protein
MNLICPLFSSFKNCNELKTETNKTHTHTQHSTDNKS